MQNSVRINAGTPGALQRSSYTTRRALLGYGLAVALTAFTLFLRVIVMQYQLGEPPALLLFLLPIIIAAYVGGLGPGLLASFLAAVSSAYYLLPPQHSFYVKPGIYRAQLFTLAAEGVLLSLLVESLHRATKKGERANNALRENQARLSGVISSAMDAIVTVDQEHRIILFNCGAEKMFGCNATEAMGQPLTRFIPECLSPELFADGRQDTEIKTTGHLEALHGMRAGGEEFPLEVSIAKTDLDGQKIFTAIVRDRTERRRAEAELYRSRERLSLAMDVAKLGTWDRYFPEDRMEMSPHALAAFGLGPNDQRSYKQYLELLHPDDREKMEQARQAAWESNRDFDLELRTIWPDGSIHWIAMRGRPYRDENGNPVRASGVLQEITDRKLMAEAQLRSQKLESLGTLAGGIAHDFNNILMAVDGNASLALEDLGADHPAQNYLNEIRKSSRRAADLVRQILTFSRPQNSQRKVLQLESVVNEAIQLVRASLPAMIEIRSCFAPNLPPVAVDASLIQQVVVNLATNASHAIDHRAGLIELVLSKTDAVPVNSAIQSVSPGPYVVLKIKDNGSGMDAATQERIFDPFFTTKAVGQGTGLGLFVVAGIIRSHGGAIHVHSEPGKGTEFYLYFPMASALSTAAIESRPVPRGKNQHVLYIDDEEALVFLLKRTLTGLGYRITAHTDPEAALHEFTSAPQNFDAVVTDLAMPRISGFDVARRILAIRPDIPVLMISGFVRPEDEALAASIGVREVILKPNEHQGLGLALHEALKEPAK